MSTSQLSSQFQGEKVSLVKIIYNWPILILHCLISHMKHGNEDDVTVIASCCTSKSVCGPYVSAQSRWGRYSQREGVFQSNRSPAVPPPPPLHQYVFLTGKKKKRGGFSRVHSFHSELTALLIFHRAEQRAVHRTGSCRPTPLSDEGADGELFLLSQVPSCHAACKSRQSHRTDHVWDHASSRSLLLLIMWSAVLLKWGLQVWRRSPRYESILTLGVSVKSIPKAKEYYSFKTSRVKEKWKYLHVMKCYRKLQKKTSTVHKKRASQSTCAKEIEQVLGRCTCRVGTDDQCSSLQGDEDKAHCSLSLNMRRDGTEPTEIQALTAPKWIKRL